MKPLGDNIAECMDDTGVEASFDEFEQAFCKRCLNPGCKRSRMNNLKWQQRMQRQAEAIYSPTFADPDDPSLRDHANQDFESFERSQARTTQWDSFGPDTQEPEKFQEEPEPEQKAPERVVHKADPPKKKHDGTKHRDAVSKLAGLNGKEVPADTNKNVSEPVTEQEDVVESVPQRQEPPTEAQERPPKRETKKPLDVSKRSSYNTDVPDDGMVLKPRQEILKPSQKSQKPANDPWAVNDGKKQKLVVRADSGEIVDPSQVKRTDKDEDDNSGNKDT
jgi:hypothetical protein